MPIITTDVVTVLRVDSTQGVRVQVNFADPVTGEDKGTYGYEWATPEEFEAFLNEGESEERVMLGLLRTALSANYDADAKVVDEVALAGKAFSVDSKPVLSEAVALVDVGAVEVGVVELKP